MADFSRFAEQIRTDVEAFLDSRLVPEKVEAPRLVEAMRYSLFSGGKRIRPVLVFAAAQAVRSANQTKLGQGCLPPETMVASAIECIHTYSLIHDDLPAMDDDDLRRGKPTCHCAFDEATAILAGDALLNFGFQLLIEAIEEYGKPLVRAARVVGDATGFGGMVTGQVLDLEATKQSPTPAQVEQIHRHKTGALLRASVLSGGLTAEATPQQEQALAVFGESIGLVFQIIDDLLDLEQTTEQLGKRTGKDAAQHKMTYPAAFGVEKSKQMAAELTHQAEQSLALFGPHAENLQALADLLLRRDH